MEAKKNFNEGYFYSAQIYSALKNFDKADIFYNKVKRNHRLFIESQISIASNNNKRGLFEKSEQHLKKLINIYKENVELSVALANLYRMKKKYAEAISHYTNIINLKNSLFDDHWRIFYLRGICYERLNQWNLAEKDFLYSLKINPNSSQVLNYLAYGWLERDIKKPRSD